MATSLFKSTIIVVIWTHDVGRLLRLGLLPVLLGHLLLLLDVLERRSGSGLRWLPCRLLLLSRTPLRLPLLSERGREYG